MANNTTLNVPLSDGVDTVAIENAAEGTMSLIDTLIDLFDGAVGAEWNDQEIANGTITQAGGEVVFLSPAGGDAAYRIYDQPIDKTANTERVYSVMFRANNPFVSSNFPFIIFNSALSPTGGKDNVTEYLPDIIFDVFISNLGALTLRVVDSGGTRLTWDTATGQWAAGNNTALILLVDTDYILEFHHDAINTWFVLKDASGKILMCPEAFAWADVIAYADSGWVITGEMRLDQVQDMTVKQISFPRDTVTGSSPAGEWLQAPVGTTFDMSTLINKEANTVRTNTRYTWYKDDSGVAEQTSVTFAAMAIAGNNFVSTNTNALKIVPQLNTTDVSETPVLNINALVQVESAGACDYPDTADVLNEVVYDSGNLTGTLLKYSVDTDPGDSIRQQIIDVLTTRFATILISNGYKTNMGNNVTHWRASRSDVSKAKLPHLSWEDADSDEIDATVGQVDHSLEITCKISAQSIDDVYAARADLIQAIGADVFMSGLAGNTTPPVEQGSVVQGEEKTWGQEYKFIIEYPTDRFDEYNQ